VPRLRLVGEPINRGCASSPPRGVYTLVVFHGVTLFVFEVDPWWWIMCAGGVLVCVSKPPRSGGAVAQADARELCGFGFSFPPRFRYQCDTTVAVS
jgi:hypothetical protein